MMDLTCWKGFVFTNHGAVFSRTNREITDEDAKCAGLKSLSTACKARRIYFIATFYAEKTLTEVVTLFQDTYGGTVCAFCMDDHILHVSIDENTPSFQKKTWPDEISGSIVSPPMSYENRGKLMVSVIEHVVDRYQKIEDKLLDVYAELGRHKATMSWYEADIKSGRDLIVLLERSNSELRGEITNLTRKLCSQSVMERDLAEYRRRCAMLESANNTLAIEKKTIVAHNTLIQQQLAQISGTHGDRVDAIENGFKSSIANLRKDMSAWTESVLERSRILDNVGSAASFGIKPIKRSLENPEEEGPEKRQHTVTTPQYVPPPPVPDSDLLQI